MSNELAVMLTGDPPLVEAFGDPTTYIAGAMERATERLAQIPCRTRAIPQMVTLHRQAEAVRLWAHSRKLDAAALDAAAVVRRAERAVALAIRAGQAGGTIRPPKSHTGNQYTGASSHDDGKISPSRYATKGELMGGGGDGTGGSKPGWYHLADNVTDEQFEKALAAATAERNLSRINLWRHLRPAGASNGSGWVPDAMDRGGEASIRRRELIASMAAEGYSSRQISKQIGTFDGTVRRIAREEGIDIPADKSLARTKHHDGDRIVEEITHILEGAAMSLTLVDPAGLDQSQTMDWAASLRNSTRDINRFARSITMRETASDHQD